MEWMDALESQGERYVCMIIHPIGAEVELACSFRDASPESLFGILETQRTILLRERTVDIVDVLCALSVRERWVQDHHSTAVHDEAYLPPKRTVQPLGEIRQRLLEECPGERDVVDGFKDRSCRCGRQCHVRSSCHWECHHDRSGLERPLGGGLGESVHSHLGGVVNMVRRGGMLEKDGMMKG